MERLARGEEGLAIFIEDEEPIASHTIYVNDAFARMSGYRRDQLIGHSALLLAGAKPDRRRIAQAIAAPKNEPYRTRERKHRPDGSEYEVEIRLEVLRSAEADAPARIVLTQRELEDA